MNFSICFISQDVAELLFKNNLFDEVVCVAFKIKTFYNLCFVGGYELVKADSECWPTKQNGLTSITKPSMKGKKGFPQNDRECGHKARQMGVKLFLTCHNVRGFYCYVYSPKAKAYLTDTCEMKHNTGKCNIYRVTKGKKDTSLWRPTSTL